AWNNVGALPKGDGVVVQWNTIGPGPNQGIEWYDPQLSTIRHVTDAVSHYDVGLDATGNEVLVTECGQPSGPSTNTCTGVSQSIGPPFMASYYLNGSGPTGQTINLYPHQYPILAEGVHVSCRNQYQRPGWCYISDYANNPSTSVGYQQIYALKLDGSQIVEV